MPTANWYVQVCLFFLPFFKRNYYYSNDFSLIFAIYVRGCWLFCLFFFISFCLLIFLLLFPALRSENESEREREKGTEVEGKRGYVNQNVIPPDMNGIVFRCGQAFYFYIYLSPY